MREQIEDALKSMNEQKQMEQIVKSREHLRKLVAFESLFLNVNLLILTPQNAGTD